MRQRQAIPMALRLGLAGIAAVGFTSVAAAQKLAWGSFKDNGCIGESDQRNYSSVLWNIPSGQDWIAVCTATPALVTLRDGSKVRFPAPTSCTKSSINGVLGLASTIIGVPGLVYKPAGAVSLVLGAGSIAMEQGGIGALNVWGVFHVVDASCRGHRAPGFIQSIGVTPQLGASSVLHQSYLPGRLGRGQVRVCFINHGVRNRTVMHDLRTAGPYRAIGTLGGQQCASMPSAARVTFTLLEDGRPSRPTKPIVMSLNSLAGGLVTFAWKD